MKKIRIALVALLLLCVAAAGGGASVVSARAAGAEIHVIGEASLKLRPDGAEFSVGITTLSAEAQSAADDNEAAYRAVYNALTGAGAAAEDIATEYYNVYPVYDYEHGRKLTGYEVNRTLKCRLRFAGVADALKAAVEAGATNVDSLRYFVDDYAAAYRRALILALNDAETKAQQLSETGLTLKSVTEEQCCWAEPKFDNASEAGGEFEGLAEIFVRLSVVYGE